jgi:hypothetical protein
MISILMMDSSQLRNLGLDHGVVACGYLSLHNPLSNHVFSALCTFR